MIIPLKSTFGGTWKRSHLLILSRSGWHCSGWGGGWYTQNTNTRNCFCAHYILAEKRAFLGGKKKKTKKKKKAKRADGSCWNVPAIWTKEGLPRQGRFAEAWRILYLPRCSVEGYPINQIFHLLSTDDSPLKEHLRPPSHIESVGLTLFRVGGWVGHSEDEHSQLHL